jgi:hypothetical protein
MNAGIQSLTQGHEQRQTVASNVRYRQKASKFRTPIDPVLIDQPGVDSPARDKLEAPNL